MTAHQIIFYLLAAFILVTGAFAVTGKKVFRSAIWLLFALMGIAGLYFWMQVEFIAAVQIAVYVGGIVVLIIFSIFLTEQSDKELPRPAPVRTLAAALSAIFGIVLSSMLIYQYGFSLSSQPFDFSVARMGTAMLATGADGFSLPFEAVSLLLLSAMVGCIVIAMKAGTVGSIYKTTKED